MEQRRISTRSRTLLEGWVLMNNRSSRIECTVRDISETGARLMFHGPVQIPPEFELEVPKRKLSSHARLVWSEGQAHGVMFVDAPERQFGGELPEPIASSAVAPEVRAVLSDARGRVAQLIDVPVETIRLNLEIDG